MAYNVRENNGGCMRTTTPGVLRHKEDWETTARTGSHTCEEVGKRTQLSRLVDSLGLPLGEHGDKVDHVRLLLGQEVLRRENGRRPRRQQAGRISRNSYRRRHKMMTPPLDQFPKLGYSATSVIPTPNDMFSGGSRPGLISCVKLFGQD